MTTKLSLVEVAELHRGQRGCGISTLEARCSEERWQDLRDAHWGALGAEITKYVGESTVEREGKMLRAVQGNTTLVASLSGLIGLEVVRLRPLIEAGALPNIQSALLLRTLASATRSLSNAQATLIAAERTLTQGGDTALRRLFDEFNTAWDAYTGQRDRVVQERIRDVAALEVPPTNGSTPSEE